MTQHANIAFRLAQRTGAFARDERGTTTVAFVMMLPVVYFAFLWTFELSWMKARHTVLHHSVDMAVRDLRLGTYPDISGNELVEQICEYGGDFLGSSCEEDIRIAMVTVSTGAWSIPDDVSQCQDRSAQVSPVIYFDPTTENSLMVLSVCLLVDPFFPGTKLANRLQDHDGDGDFDEGESGIRLFSSSAFAVEPGGA